VKYINRFFLETISQTGMILCMDDDMMVMSEICDFCADLKSNMAATISDCPVPVHIVLEQVEF